MPTKKCKGFLTKIKSIDDISKRRLESVMKWFIGIKVFDGKKENSIAYDGRILGRDRTLEVIEEAYTDWKKLLSCSEPEYK